MRDELRIGNLVRTSIYYDTEEAKEDLGEDYSEDKEWIIDTVQGICHESEEYMYWGESEVEDGTNRTEGIPLTEKWLEKTQCSINKTGLAKYFNYRLDDYSKVTLMLCNDKGKGEFYVMIHQEDEVVSIPRRMFFVHEWQNLFYALTTTELKWEEKIKEKA